MMRRYLQWKFSARSLRNLAVGSLSRYLTNSSENLRVYAPQEWNSLLFFAP